MLLSQVPLPVDMDYIFFAEEKLLISANSLLKDLLLPFLMFDIFALIKDKLAP